MALDNNEKSLCNKLLSDFDSLIQPGKSARGEINAAGNQMASLLKGYAGAGPTAGLDTALEQYRRSALGNMPGDSLDDLQSFKNFLDNCEYLDFLEPVSAMLGTILGIFNELGNLINGLDLNFPEFGMSGLGSLIDKILDALPGLPGGDVISDLLAAADKLLECLNSACAAQDPTYIGDLSDMTQDLNDLYGDLNVVDDPLNPSYGKFNYANLYNDAGLSTSEIGAIDTVKSGINASKDDGVNAVDSAAKAIQEATKIGELF